MNSNDVINSLSRGMLRGLVSLLDDDALQEAVTAAEDETTWVLPFEGKSKCYWFIQRAARHALVILMNTNANKFNYKQIKLSNRFEQYRTRVQDMDAEWAAADLPADTSEERIAQFGHVATTGLATDAAGRDRTFDPNNHVQIYPNKEK
jgi:hypothetical protein